MKGLCHNCLTSNTEVIIFNDRGSMCLSCNLDMGSDRSVRYTNKECGHIQYLMSKWYNIPDIEGYK